MRNQNIAELFPEAFRGLFLKLSRRQNEIQEIRLRGEQPISVVLQGREYFLDRQGDCQKETVGSRVLTMEELTGIVNHICQYSLYAYEEELKQGFLTVEGGHRVGVTGQAVLKEDDQIRTLKYINGLNIRIAHEILGAADNCMPYIYERGKVRNVMIISPPGCGKTTLLRDMIRQISDGNVYGTGVNVGVVDERSEIAGCFKGSPQNHVGCRTDILDRCPKERGMLMLIRAMAPKVVAIDEVGDEKEWKALAYAAYCGAAVIATMHGEGLEDYIRRSSNYLKEKEEIFQTCIVMGKVQGNCVVKQIYQGTDGGGWKCLL